MGLDNNSKKILNLFDTGNGIDQSDSYAAIKPDAKIDAGRLRIFILWKQ